MTPNSWQNRLARQLEDLHLIRCSLLPGERLDFVLPQEDLAIWISLLDAFTDADDPDGMIASLADPPCQARFEVRVAGSQTWFEVTLPLCTSPDVNTSASLTVSVKGEDVSRETHERWTAEINARIAELDEGCAFPAYELLTQLTAILHQSHNTSPSPSSSPVHSLGPLHHALLTSHHLVSSTKRRTMHSLASHLGLAGFAKVGYPGIMYVEGPRDGVEAFVREVKAMQWLALRIRFVEPIPDLMAESLDIGASRGWAEVSKIGEVLELMRLRGREELVTSLGIGASSKEPKR